MSTDEKQVSLFEIMTSGYGQCTLEDDVHYLLSPSAQSERRMQLLEYRSIDQEAQSHRNNLIFRCHVEVAGDANPEAIIPPPPGSR